MAENKEASRFIDPLLAIAAGADKGIEVKNKFGRVAALAANTLGAIWDVGGPYPFPTSETITHIRQQVDQAAMRGATITIEGADINYNTVLQTKTLDASNTSTLVALDTPLFRIRRMAVSFNAVIDSPVEAINAGDTVIYARMSTGETTGYNQTLMCVDYVPAGYTAYLRLVDASFNPATNQDPSSMLIHLFRAETGSGFAPCVEHTTGLDASGSSFIPIEYPLYKKIEEKNDFWVQGYAVGKAADISARITYALVKN